MANRSAAGTRAAAAVAAVVLVLSACQYLAALPSDGGLPASPTLNPTPTPTTSVGAQSATPLATPTASVEDVLNERMHTQARDYLAHWAQLVADAPPDALVFTGELAQGGGWDGPNAGSQKQAFMSGRLEANRPLATETPPPADVRWPDGSTTTVALIAAAQALEDMAAAYGGGKCTDCAPLRVTGATLVTGKVDTARGPASVPLWQFQFVADDEPITPITFVAVRDRVVVVPLPWDPSGTNNPVGLWIEAAYGSASSATLTAAFTGAPGPGSQICGEDYTAEAVESEMAVVVIIHAHHAWAWPSASAGTNFACTAVGARRTAVAALAAPLGNRVVLDVVRGMPVPLLSGTPPG